MRQPKVLGERSVDSLRQVIGDGARRSQRVTCHHLFCGHSAFTFFSNSSIEFQQSSTDASSISVKASSRAAARFFTSVSASVKTASYHCSFVSLVIRFQPFGILSD